MAIRSGAPAQPSGNWTQLDSIGWIDRRWIEGSVGPTRIDPYCAWAEATDYAYLYPNTPPKWLPLILEVSGNADAHAATAAQFAEHIATLRGDADEFWIEIPAVYRYPPRGLEQTTHFTAIVTQEFFARLSGEQWLRDAIAAFELCLPVVPANDFAAKPAPEAGIVNPPGILVAILDDGLAYLHERFRKDGGSRVEYCWNQEPITPTSVKPAYGAIPPGVGYGWELRKDGPKGIDTLLTAATHPAGGLVDEDEAYRLSGVSERGVPANRSVRRRRAHGTHVLDLACGASPGDQEPAHSIIAVQLPSRTTRDTSGATLYKQVLDAMRYILARAQELANAHQSPDWPVVVNLSYGTIAGPHDGTGRLEAALDQIIEARKAPLAVVLPEGNCHLARCHAHFSLDPGAIRTLQWRVLPDDMTPSHIEVWLPRYTSAGTTPQVEIQVTTPSGDASPWVAPGAVLVWQLPTGVLGMIAYLAQVAQSNRGMILVLIAPTATLHPTRPVAPSGRWQVAVKNTGAQVEIDAWIQRDDTPFGYPVRGRQSRFEDFQYARRDPVTGREVETFDATAAASWVRRAGTQNAIATGYNTVVVGGFRRSDRRAASYSSCGPILPPSAAATRARDGPDALTVSEDSPAQYGVLAAGTRSGSVFAMNGTSAAAPQMTRAIANLLAGGAAKPIWQVVDQLAATEEAKPPAKPPLPAQRKGYGRVAFAPLVHPKNQVKRNTPR